MYSKYPKHEVLPLLLSAAAASPAQKSLQDQGYAEKAPAAVPTKTFSPLQQDIFPRSHHFPSPSIHRQCQRDNTTCAH